MSNLERYTHHWNSFTDDLDEYFKLSSRYQINRWSVHDRLEEVKERIDGTIRELAEFVVDSNED